jgi:hypothetical protein
LKGETRSLWLRVCLTVYYVRGALGFSPLPFDAIPRGLIQRRVARVETVEYYGQNRSLLHNFLDWEVGILLPWAFVVNCKCQSWAEVFGLQRNDSFVLEIPPHI